MAENFSAEFTPTSAGLKQIKCVSLSNSRGDKYLFCRSFIIVKIDDAASRKAGLNAPLRNFSNAIFSHANSRLFQNVFVFN